MAPIDWNLAGKIVMRELTRAKGPAWRGYEQDDATTRRVVQALMRDPCGVQDRLLGVDTMPLYRAVACYAAIVARMPPSDQRDILQSLDDPGWTTCLSLAASYGSDLSLSKCPAPVMQDPAYASIDAARAASWNPFDPSAGAVWRPGYAPGREQPGEHTEPKPPLGSDRPEGDPPTSSAGTMLALCQGGTRQACEWLAYCERTSAQDPSCGFYCELDPSAKGCATTATTETGADARPWYKHPAAIVVAGAMTGVAAALGVRSLVSRG